MPDTILQIERQEAIEQRYNRALIDRKIRQEIEDSPVMQLKINKSLELLDQWMAMPWYPAKRARLDALKPHVSKSLIENIFIGIAYFQQAVLFTSAVGQLAGRLGLPEKRDALLTMGEILAILCRTDAFDIGRKTKMDSLLLISRIPLSQELNEFIWSSAFLPPMVCEPLEIRKNYDGVYLSHKESMLLGAQNHHEGNICLDVLNLINKVPLKLATDFLCKVEEDPNSEFTVEKAKAKALKKGKVITDAKAEIIVQNQKEHWHRFKKVGYAFYQLMVQMGNTFHLPHKYDKRGRLYAMGYHITTQGTSFKKASIELANEEIVEGVPV